MKKLFALFSIAATTFGLSGCRMCCPSYDYTSPTDPGSCNNEYCGNERRGSIFSGYTSGAVASDETGSSRAEARSADGQTDELRRRHRSSLGKHASRTLNCASIAHRKST